MTPDEIAKLPIAFELLDADRGKPIDFQLDRGDGVFQDVTGGTITLLVTPPGAVADSARTMSIVDGVNGVVRYTTITSGADFTANDKPFTCRVKTVVGSEVTHYRIIAFKVNGL